MLSENSRRTCTLLLAMLLLSSCGQAEPVSEDTQDTTSGTNVETVETVAESEYISPGTDWEGATFTIGAADYYKQGGGVWVAQDYCEAYADATGDPLHDALFERNNLVEEELNIDLDVYSFTALGGTPGTELKQLVQAGETLIDMASLPGSSLPTVLSAGILLDMHTIPGIDFSHSWWDEASVETFEIVDNLYAAASDFNLSTAFSPITFFFSKTLVEQHDLGDLYSMVQEGTWTMDAAIAMSETVSQDTNGNGEVDILEDTFGMLMEAVSMTSAIFGGGVKLTEMDAAGKPVIAIDSERASAIVEKMQSFFFNDKTTLHNGRIKGYSNVFTELFLPTFQENRALFYNNQLLVALNLREMDADFGILPHPKYDTEQESYYGPVNNFWATFVTVPVTNGRLALTGDVVEALGYYSQQVVTPTYIEKTIQGKTLRDAESEEMLNIILHTRVYDLGSIYDWGGISSMFSSLGNDSNLQFSSTYASKEKGIQTAIDKTIKEIENANG